MTPRPARRRWPLGLVGIRAVLNGHGLLGLGFAALVYLVCLSGTIAVFLPDLKRWEQPGLPAVATIDDRSIARAIEHGLDADPGVAALYLSLPTDRGSGASLLAYRPEIEREWAVAGDGALVPVRTPWTRFVVDLHERLHLPRLWGRSLVGLIGVALFSLLVSGVLAHPRIVKDAFHLRRGGGRRLQEADLHNRLGIWALPFHAVIAATGATLGLSLLIAGVLSMLVPPAAGGMTTAGAARIDPAPLPDIARLLATVRRGRPEATPSQINITRPGRSDASIAIEALRPRLLVPQDVTTFDARGRLLAQQRPADASAGAKLIGGVGQLHFGWFGGWPMRVAYGLLGLATCVVTASGVDIWLARRRDRGREVPGWERLWAVVTWGQPALLALLGIGATLVPRLADVALAPAWLLATIASLSVAAMVQSIAGPSIARLLRCVTAVGLIGLAGVHALCHVRDADTVFWVVSLCPLGSGILLMARSSRFPRLG